ncbi:MAG: metallophosphoesterase [Alistipes sp.]|nr:metallophosphoesterase [Alistipes sp.]MBP3601810.1 metallophosphoesterase [Alistipes sp.]
MEMSFNIIALLLASGAILLLDLAVAGVAVVFGATFKAVFVKGLWLLLLPWVAWVYGTVVERNCFSVKRLEVESSHLPAAFDGYRVVHISDMHLKSFEGRGRALQRAVDKINALNPDVVVFTGDLVSYGHWELDGLQDILEGVKAKDGVYSVLGNHDYSEYHRWPSQQERAEALEILKRRQRDMGWQLLLNENRTIARGQEKISIIGVENISGDRHFRTYGDMAKASEGVDGEYKILLSHDPTHWRKEVVGQSDIDLTLAGHTHAMQMGFLGWSPSSLIYDEWGGLYREGEQALYVNRGLGQTLFKARIGAVPEITLIELKSKK